MIKYLLLILAVASCSVKDEELIVEITPQISGVEASFRGLSVVDKDVAWASGSNGTVLVTKDGGTHWKNISNGLPDSIDFRDIEGFSQLEAVVISAGSPGLVFRTENGGTDWELVYEDHRDEIFFDAMGFWNNKSGIAFGDAIGGLVEIIITMDNGKSWQQLAEENRPAALKGEGGFAASGTCLTTFGDSSVWIAMGIPESRVLYSGDRGLTWSSYATPMGQDTGSGGIFSIAFNSEQYGLAIGGDYVNRKSTNKLLSISDDGGKTWKLVETNGLNGQKSTVTPVLGTDTWLAAGATGVSYSINKGLTWELADTTGYYTLQMANERIGYLTGPKGRLGKITLNH